MSEFVAIDVETANAFMGSICQIGAVRFQDGEAVETINWLVDPRDEFDEVNVSIHGITPGMCVGHPPFAARYDALRAFVGQAVAVCHTHFDRVSIDRASAASGLPAPGFCWLDSARVARRTWPDVSRAGYGLAPLAARFGVEFRHHDAAEDARAAGLVLLRAMAESGHDLARWLKLVERSVLPTDRDAIRRSGDGDGPLVGESIVFTGALAMPRREAADRAHILGAAVEPGVTKHTTMLVVGDQDLHKLAGHTKSSKHRKVEALIAAGHAIRIVAECDFMAFPLD